MTAGRVSLGRLLRLAAAVLASIALVAAFFLRVLPSLRGGGGVPGALSHPEVVGAEAAFARADAAIARSAAAPADGRLLREALSALEQRSGHPAGVSTELSFLKRHRALAASVPGARPSYFAAALSAAARFPAAAPLAALVADAALGVDPASAEADAALRDSASKLDPAEYPVLSLLLRSRLGTLREPAEADRRALLAAADAYAPVDPAASRALAADAALSGLLSSEPMVARSIAAERLSALDALASRELLFLADLEADFGDPLRAASLYSRLEGPEAAYRRGDAYRLASLPELARAAWLEAAAASPRYAPACLYNAAAAVPDTSEALSFLSRLRAADPAFPAGAVLQSRLLGGPAGADVLREALRLRPAPELELELLRTSGDGAERVAGRCWLLFNARPEDPLVARWVSWYFAANGRTAEAFSAMAEHVRRGGGSADALWYAALEDALSGRLDDAEARLETVSAERGDWRIAANLGAVAFARRRYETARSLFSAAAKLCPRGSDAADLFVRIAATELILGDDAAARRSLQYALDLDGNNRKARTELKKLGGL